MSALLQRLRSKLDTELGRHLFDIVDTRAVGTELTPTERTRLRKTVEDLARRALPRSERKRMSLEQRQRVVDTILSEQLGMGPLQPLLDDPSVSQIMVNGPSTILVERQGRLEPTDVRFKDHHALMAVVERVLSAVGRSVSLAEPYADARLLDGSRIHVMIAPVDLNGPHVTIRKLARRLLSIEELVRLGSISAQAARFLQACVHGRLNLLISGPSSSGKTVMLNALAEAIPRTERVVIIEDPAELHVPGHHVVRLEARPPNVEGRGEITARQLLKNALHVSPDRILIGEVRGNEALDLLQALHTGHDGSMTTLHANDPRDALDRLVVLALLAAGQLSSSVVERQVFSAIDLVVHLERFGDGRRQITQISEVVHDQAAGEVVDLFAMPVREDRAASVLHPTGVRPAFLARLARRGAYVPDDVFASRRA